MNTTKKNIIARFIFIAGTIGFVSKIIPANIANIKYKVPISLALVENNHLVIILNIFFYFFIIMMYKIFYYSHISLNKKITIFFSFIKKHFLQKNTFTFI